MLQVLLADRFKLNFHHEMKQLPAYALVLGKNGAKMKARTPGDGGPGWSPPEPASALPAVSILDPPGSSCKPAMR